MFLANDHHQATTYFPETSTKYETDQMNTTSNEQTTSSNLGNLLISTLFVTVKHFKVIILYIISLIIPV